MQIEIKESVEILAEMMRDDPDYQRYVRLCVELEKNPRLAFRVSEFRRKNYEIQNSSGNPEQAFWDLNNEFLELYKIPLVNAYLDAEMSVCRMLQGIVDYICSEIRVPKL